jgi:hypothetical protein
VVAPADGQDSAGPKVEHEPLPSGPVLSAPKVAPKVSAPAPAVELS